MESDLVSIMQQKKSQFQLTPTIGPKLKFCLFPLTRPTLKKSPYSENFISILSQELFFLNVNSVILTDIVCVFNFIAYSRTMQKNLPKTATQRYTQQRSLRQMSAKCRSKVLQNAPWEHSAVILTCIINNWS